MHMHSTDYLNVIAQNDLFILLEKAVPSGILKGEMITLIKRDGKALVLNKSGYSASPVDLPRSIFDDFKRASLIEQDREEDNEGRIFFRLTEDGKAKAKQVTP